MKGLVSTIDIRPQSSIRDVLFVDLLALSFYALLHVLYDIRIIGLDNYTASPSTVIAINHKRDLDFPMITPILHVRKTFFRPRLRPCLVARDDMFESGYFTSHSPSTLPFGRLLHHWNPAPILRPLPAYPISHLVRKPLRALHELPTDVGILRGELPRQVRTHSIKMIDEQLHVFAHVLDEGGTCLLAPEGNLWPDGRFWPVKSGLHRLISMTKADARILPVNITYDFMTQGRMPIYVTLGEEILGARELPRVKLETLTQRRLVSLGPVTMGQLGSEYILEMLHGGKERFQKQEFAEHLVSRMAQLKRAGLRLEDRLANALSFQAHLDHFMQYCVGRRILTKSLPDTYGIQREKALGRTGPNYWQNPIQYSYNELRSLREVYPGL